MSKSTFPTQPILAIPWIEPCNLVVPVLTIKNKKIKKIKKLNQYLYENYKGNKDYDLNLNNEIAKVEQLEIEIGKSMMSLVFWEMWNENHGEIDEKVWVNQKTKKIKDEIRVCDSYLIEAKNTMPRETKSHKTEINSYLIGAVRFL